MCNFYFKNHGHIKTPNVLKFFTLIYRKFFFFDIFSINVVKKLLTQRLTEKPLDLERKFAHFYVQNKKDRQLQKKDHETSVFFFGFYRKKIN